MSASFRLAKEFAGMTYVECRTPIRFALICTCLVLTLDAISPVRASSAQDKELSKVKGDSDRPPQPRSDNFDWIQLKNGEWLKGEIEEFQDENLSFESDELDTVEIDWEDVYALYSAKACRCSFSDRTSVQGILSIEGERVTVQTPAGERAFSREELRSIIPRHLKERDYWSLKWSMGVTMRSGNTEQRDVASFLSLQRRSSLARTRFELSSSYGSSEGKENTSNQRAMLRQDIYLSKRLFLTPFSIQYYRDKFQNIEYDLTPGAGLGYGIIDQSNMEWDLDVGGGYNFTRYQEVGAGEDSTRQGAALLAGTRFTWELTKTIDFDLHYDATIGLEEYVNTNHHALAQLSFDVWKDLDFDVSLTWDRVGKPQDRKDGSAPDSDDVRLFVGLGLEL
jgi:putative salt-induced outer membrane protein YdiY